ncbi:endonuclease domain-containing protein [Phascolarctobacterium succinatutens]|uniref:endonuclease domain-containing protein n=1 Tax=Phascolarctobacterium succinatutens TaxID=626940 RepID=UPI003078FA7E
MFNNLSDRATKNFAKKLRRVMTKQEKHLWYDFLQNCGHVKLIVELDGSQHYEDKHARYDERRTAYFNDLGITVIRFPNNAIDKNFNSVCDEIEKVVSALELIMKT